MIRDPDALLSRLRLIHAAIRDALVADCERAAERPDLDGLSAVVASEAGDTVFAIDRVSEGILLPRFADLAREWPMLLIAEGLAGTGRQVMPDRATPEIAVIVDPIDGTRGLLYQKRPAWILTGVAPYRGDATSLSDIELALQTEIPLVKQHLTDSVWAVRGREAGGERLNRLTGDRRPLATHPSRAVTIAQGFGSLARFFPGGRALLAEIDDVLVERTLGSEPGRALAFEDQYIATGGQLYELMMGHDRWCADLRPLVWAAEGRRGLCCHPYDLSTELIARAAGVIVTDARGRPLDAPLDVDADVAWIGYANASIRAEVEPVLQHLLKERGLSPPTGGRGFSPGTGRRL
jgi:fructose-1,6-bisphosphatase/inositol monophosphatase family enzyme